MSRLPDLVRDTRLSTSFKNGLTIHHHDDSDEENDARSTWRSECWKATVHLGRGGCGDVWLQECVDGKRRYGKRAVKIIPRLKLKDKKDSYNYIAELEAIAKFSQKPYSKCFVKLLGWYDTDSDLFIAMEYFPLGDLQSYMVKAGPIDEADARAILFQLLEGLSYMHREGFAHRDIKPGNVLIRSQPPKGKWWVKLSDFGISKRIEDSAKALSSVAGTVPYMSPELLWREPGGSTVIDYKAADMWALGEMAYRILTQTGVFPTPNALVNYLVNTNSFPTENLSNHNASSDAVSFIRSLMEPQPDQRHTSEKALEHAWIAPLRQKDHWTPASVSSTPAPSEPSPSSTPWASATDPDPWATVSTNGLLTVGSPEHMDFMGAGDNSRLTSHPSSGEGNLEPGSSVTMIGPGADQVSVHERKDHSRDQSNDRHAIEESLPIPGLDRSDVYTTRLEKSHMPDRKEHTTGRRPKTKQTESHSKAMNPNQNKPPRPSSKYHIDIRPLLKNMLDELKEEQEAIEDGTYRNGTWEEKKARLRRMEAERVKSHPGGLEQQKLESREFERVSGILGLEWPEEPLRLEIYEYPNTYEKAYDEYVRKCEHNLRRMHKKVKNEIEQREGGSQWLAPGRKLLDVFGFRGEARKEDA